MPPTQHETGLVSGDPAVHAVQKRINGNVALCGAGAISQPMAGRFDSDAAQSCAVCCGQVSGTP
jgi:hypothetical protein